MSSETTHIDFLDFLDFYDANRRTRDRDLAKSRNRDRGERRKEEKRSHRKPRARARRGGADGEGTPRSPPSRAFDRHSTTPTRRVPGPRPNANERANDAERFVRTDHAYARARRRSHRARAGGLYDRPSLADASAARFAELRARIGAFVSARLAIDAGAFYSRRRAEAVRGLTDPARPFARHQALFVPWRVFQRGRGRV